MTNSKIKGIEKLTGREIAEKFQKFVSQKPGFSGYDYSDRSSYQSDYNYYKKFADKNRTLRTAHLEEIFDNLTPEELAHRVFDNRLMIDEKGEMEYITGQYFPTEYQAQAYNSYEKAKRIYDLKNQGKW